MIVILDYGMGNPASIQNMLRKAGSNAMITMDASVISRASGIILPGVGSFDNGMLKLKASGAYGLIEKRVLVDKVPFLGICLGMQLLFNTSEEGEETGLGWIDGTVKRFDFHTIKSTHNLKIPHMGWSVLSPKSNLSLYRNMCEDSRFYFVHSYHAVCSNPVDILATSHYGYNFTCSVQKENIFGVQFHPEKSHRFGMTVLKNFAELASC